MQIVACAKQIQVLLFWKFLELFSNIFYLWLVESVGSEADCVEYCVPILFKLYAEDIMRNAGLGDAQAGIKIARRNFSNLRYADVTTLMAESKELQSLLMEVKEKNEKLGLKLNIQETKNMASSPITSWQYTGKQWKQ